MNSWKSEESKQKVNVRRNNLKGANTSLIMPGFQGVGVPHVESIGEIYIKILTGRSAHRLSLRQLGITGVLLRVVHLEKPSVLSVKLLFTNVSCHRTVGVRMAYLHRPY